MMCVSVFNLARQTMPNLEAEHRRKPAGRRKPQRACRPVAHRLQQRATQQHRKRSAPAASPPLALPRRGRTRRLVARRRRRRRGRLRRREPRGEAAHARAVALGGGGVLGVDRDEVDEELGAPPRLPRFSGGRFQMSQGLGVLSRLPRLVGQSFPDESRHIATREELMIAASLERAVVVECPGPRSSRRPLGREGR